MANNRSISATLQIGAVMASSVRSVFGGLGRHIDTLGSNLAKLKRQSADISRLQVAQGKLAEAKARGNVQATKRYQEQVDKLSASLKAAGVNTQRLTAEQVRLNSSLSRGQGSLTFFRGLNGLVGKGAAIGKTFADVSKQVSALTLKMSALGVGAGYLFKTQFVDTAAEFERLQTVLKTLEGGDVNKAKAAFGWISKFATETPYDVKGVTAAFVKLRAYGIDPIAGDTLRALGDTSSAMGKDLMQSVEAIADAVTGENERLKEFGIKAAKDKNKIVYEYTNRAGKQQRKTVDANNREMIRSTLMAIWNEKYAGAMKEQSKTWNGMMSNLGDQWDRFTMMVMASGVFDWMKTELGGLLAEVDKAAEDGRLKAWAIETGQAIKTTFIAMKDFGVGVRDAVVWVKDLVGGWKNFGIVVAAIALAPTIASVVQLGSAVWSLGAAVVGLLGPWGLLAVAVVGAGIALYTWRNEIKAWLDMQPAWLSGLLKIINPLPTLIVYWDQVSAAILRFKDTIGTAIDWALEKINSLFAKMQELGSASIGGMKLGDIGGTMLDLNPITAPARLMQRAASSLMPKENMPAAGGGTVNNQVQVKIDARGADGDGIADKLRSSLQSKPLFDETTVLQPR